MKIPFSGLTGPFLAFAVKVNEAFAGLKLDVVATAADLPNATANDRRQIIVRDVKLTATAIDGAWYDPSGGAI